MTTGELVLLRHGESTYNAGSRFTGLLDVPLSDEGERQAVEAGGMLRAAAWRPDLVAVSPMRRATHTLELLGLAGVAVEVAWQLSERDYGTLTDMPKAEVRERFGEERFFGWRRTLHGCPPAATPEQLEAWNGRGPAGLPPELRLGMGESLADVVARLEPWWREAMAPRLAAGGRVLVVAHGNSLRALVGIITTGPSEEIEDLNLPQAQPLLYFVDASGMATTSDGRWFDSTAALAAAERIAAEGGT